MTHERLADAGAIGAIGAWLVSVAVELNPVIQMFLGIAGIVAAICAARYHIKKTAEIGNDKDDSL